MAKRQKKQKPERARKNKGLKFYQVLNPIALKKEIKQMDVGEFSALNYLKFLAICYVGMIVLIFVFKLQWPYALALIALETLGLPMAFYLQFKNLYEKKKFEDIAAYIEQLLYSFKRQPKILSSLEDTVVLFEDRKDGHLYQAIQKAIAYIREGHFEEDLYKEAFAFIEEEYGCKRLYKVHEFLVRVENSGGTVKESIDIMLQDRNLWVNRIQEFVQEKQKVRINVTIGIGLSMIVVAMSTYMVPSEFGINSQWPSQLAATATFALNMLIWYFVQKALAKSLLEADMDLPFSEVERAYNLVMHDKQKTGQYKIAAGICAVGAVAAYFALGIQPAVALALFAGILVTQPGRKYKACFKRVKREVEKTFPDWLMALALQLQTDNVHVSIAKTMMDAPEILREELVKLQDNLEKHPNELEPYIGFFRKLNSADILTAMKMLYAMSEFGSDDAQEQIQGLVERNIQIMDKADRMRMEDNLAGISFAMLLPMLTGIIKMLVDLFLVMGYILGQISM